MSEDGQEQRRKADAIATRHSTGTYSTPKRTLTSFATEVTSSCFLQKILAGDEAHIPLPPQKWPLLSCSREEVAISPNSTTLEIWPPLSAHTLHLGTVITQSLPKSQTLEPSP